MRPPRHVLEAFKAVRKLAWRLDDIVTKGRLTGSVVHIIDSFDKATERGRPFCKPLVANLKKVHLVKDVGFPPSCIRCIINFRKRAAALIANPPSTRKTDEQLDREEAEANRLDEEERKREEE